MHNTIQSVLQRGERLDDIVAASERLSEQSKMFYTQGMPIYFKSILIF
jgi:synaptobrevin family protein YKT6